MIQTLFIYSLISGAMLTLLWGAYRLTGLRRLTHFRLNRICLMTILLLSALVPALAFISRHGAAEPTPGMIEIGEAEVAFEAAEGNAGLLDKVLPIASAVYAVGAAIALTRVLFGFITVASIIATGQRRRIPGQRGVTLVIHDKDFSPFTWGRWVIISAHDLESAGGEAILTHELLHLQSGHFIDLLICQTLKCLDWYWPGAWMIARDLTEAHEFEADHRVIESGINAETYQRMLVSAGRAPLNLTIANPLNFNNLKNRIIMMQKNQSSAKSRMRALALLPAAAVAILLASSPVVASAVRSALPVAATEEPAKKSDADKKTYETAEVMPKFPGGDTEMYQWIAQHLKYPEETIKNDEQGRVVIQFVVDKDGSTAEPRIIRGVSPSIDAEAIRIVNEMPQFTPGTIGGEPVRVWYTLPMTFKMYSGPKDTADKESK